MTEQREHYCVTCGARLHEGTVRMLLAFAVGFGVLTRDWYPKTPE